MPINIKEILYPGDTDFIKWEKVNYNFDQILTNGGKEGPAGVKGDSGSMGATGLKGEKGEKGDTGLKGEQGVSTNYWDQFTHSNVSAYVLKPKDGTNTGETAIFIGDDTYTEGSADGDLNPNAQLTVGQSSVYSYGQKWLPYGSNLENFTIRGEATTNYNGNGVAGTKWVLQPETGAQNTNLTIQSHVIDLGGYESINVTTANGFNILAGGDVTITPDLTVGGFTELQDSASITGQLSVGDIIDVYGENSYFRGTGGLLIPEGTTAQRPVPLTGMIRYNSSKNKFEAYHSSGTWIDLDRLSNPLKTSYISIQGDSDYANSANNEASITLNGTERVNVGGAFSPGSSPNDLVTNAIQLNHRIIASESIYINNTSGNGGITFRPGTPSTALNNANNVTGTSLSGGTAIGQRTLNDYFEWLPLDPDNKWDIDSNATESWTNNYPGNILSGTEVHITNDVFANETSTGAIEKISTIFDYSSSNLRMTKVGNMVTVWGRLYFDILVSGDIPTYGSKVQNSDILFEDASAGEQLIIKLQRFVKLPNAHSNVYFPIRANNLQYGATSNDDVMLWGVLESGSTNIKLATQFDVDNGGDSGAAIVQTANIAKTNTNSSVGITIQFTLSYPTDINSYQNTGGSSNVGGGFGFSGSQGP